MTSATLTVPEAAALLGISRGAAYEAARSGELAPGCPVIRVGPKRLVVPRVPLYALLGIAADPSPNNDLESS
jgi:excisionase family DNA binding protein